MHIPLVIEDGRQAEIQDSNVFQSTPDTVPTDPKAVDKPGNPQEAEVPSTANIDQTIETPAVPHEAPSETQPGALAEHTPVIARDIASKNTGNVTLDVNTIDKTGDSETLTAASMPMSNVPVEQSAISLDTLPETVSNNATQPSPDMMNILAGQDFEKANPETSAVNKANVSEMVHVVSNADIEAQHPIDQSDDISFAVPEIRSSDTQPEANTQTNQVTPHQTEQQLPQAEASLNEQKVIVEFVNVDVQPITSVQGFELPPSDSKVSSAKADFPVTANESQQNKNVEVNPVTTAEPEQVSPRTETIGNDKKIHSDFEKVETQPGATVQVIEAAQADLKASAIKVNLPETENDDLGNKDVKVQIVGQVKVPETIADVNISESLPARPSTKTVAPKSEEKQIVGDASATSTLQVAAEPVEDTNTAADVEVDAKVRGSTMPSVETTEKSDVARTPSMKKSETATSDAPMPFASADSPVIPVSSKPVSVEGPKEELKARQTVKDEEVHPVEKQPKMNQMPDSAAAANGPVRESVVVEHNGNVPLAQVDAQAAEVVQQVIRHINSNIKGGPASMHLQLNPKELGAIDVQMVSSAQGVHVTFFAEQASTSKLLEMQINQLRESLVDSGVQVSGLNISQHNQSGQKGETFEQSTNFARTPQRDLPQGETNPKETPHAEQRFGHSSEVDYLI